MISSAFSQVNMSWEWVRTAGGLKSQKATAIALTANNDVVVAASFTSDQISLGTNNLVLSNNDSSGFSSNYFIAKYNQNGQVLWAKKTFCNAATSSNKLVTDNNGNIYVTGFISNNNSSVNISFDGATNYTHTGGKSFLVKYSPQGITQWVLFVKNKFWGYDTIADIKWDAKTNSIIMGGYCQGDTVSIGSSNIINSGNNLHSSFIAKVDVLQGNVIWLKTTTGNSFINKINNITIDSSGNIYTTASFLGNYLVLPSTDTLINSNPSTGALLYDGYFAKYDKNGMLIWFKKTMCATNDEFTAICCRNNNRLVIGGYCNSLLSIDTILLNAGNYILEYDLFGNAINAENFPATIKTLNAFKNGTGFVIAGTFVTDSLVLGNTVLNKYGNPASLNSNIFITRSDHFGTYNAAISAGGISSSGINELVISDSNEVYVCGSYNQPSANFGAIQYNAVGISDLFLAKLNAGFSPPIPLKFNLGGTVFVGLLPVDHAIVYLYDTAQNFIDSCQVDTLGFYQFYQKSTGSFKISAELTSSSVYFYQNYRVTYYPNKISFAEAESIMLNTNSWSKNITLQIATTIDEEVANHQLLKNLKVYPNPANQNIWISINNLLSEVLTMDILNTNGQLVFSQKISSSAFEKRFHLNIELFIPGLYIVLMRDNKGNVATTRFVKSE